MTTIKMLSQIFSLYRTLATPEVLKPASNPVWMHETDKHSAYPFEMPISKMPCVCSVVVCMYVG